MQFKDYFSKQSATYAKYRPTYPDELFAYLASLCPSHNLAWDCATGNGQSANSLVNYFDKVIATDASEAQLANAKPHEKITYKLALAEESGIESSTVDLVTVSAAVHWFNFDKFYKEVNRVLKPGGVIAVWTYCNPVINPEVDKVVEKLHLGILHDYWLKENWMVINNYKDLPFPYEKLKTPDFTYTKTLDFNALEGLIASWSAVQRYIEMNGKNPFEEIREELTKAWGNPNEQKKVSWGLTVFVGKKI